MLKDFYIPALTHAKRYDRAVGYFSAAMLSCVSQGISALVANGGYMRLIVGGEIDELDAKAILEGYNTREIISNIADEIIYKIDSTVNCIDDELFKSRVRLLTWLIRNGRLDIKIALKKRGMYHEKFGIFEDVSGDKLIFQGSANETVAALSPDFNFESISVFPSWNPVLQDYYQPYLDGFDSLWNDQVANTVVIDFPTAAREKLLKTYSNNDSLMNNVMEVDLWEKLIASRAVTENFKPITPSIPKKYKGNDLKLRLHQQTALQAWANNDFNGILAMATGAGKTVTSIFGAVKLFESIGRLFLIISVPYQALADQWIDELSIFNIHAIPCFDGQIKWVHLFDEAISFYLSGSLNFAACVVVNRTLESDVFQSKLDKLPGDSLMFLGDECHHHGGANIVKRLPKQAAYKLGLSATPKHYIDTERTDSLIGYYGDVIYEYSLSDAINDGILTPYDYFVHFIYLNDDELEEYLELSSQISKLASFGANLEYEDTGNSHLDTLLFRRARLLSNASMKLDVLEKLINKDKPVPFSLFYCGDGAILASDNSESRQIDEVSKLLYRYGWKVSHFTSRESRVDRLQILDNFRTKEIDALVAMKCLDEGVDIPDCRQAYIVASSRNPKQFIQRRGRILRKANGKSYAVLHDFLVCIPDDSGTYTIESRKLFKAELRRISEFGTLARNRSDVYKKLEPLLIKYDLSHVFV